MVSISQHTDILLSEFQQIEVYKGLKQGEFTKTIINDLNNQISVLENQLLEDTQTINNLLEKINNLETIIRNNQKFIEYQEQKFELEKQKLKSKRFNLGFISGYGFTPDFKNNAFGGIGISYSIFRF